MDFSSPTKTSGRHDIYRSSPIKSYNEPSPIHESKVDIIIDDNGLIDEKLDASLMEIQGSCRRCKKVVSSYESDDHLLYCPKISRDDFDTFCIDQAKMHNTTDCDIEAVAAGYCQFEIDLSDINNVFPKASQFESFIHDLELFLDNFASKVYSSLNISGQRKRFNILNYK